MPTPDERNTDLDIYVDGSALKNPGHTGGLAAIAHFSDDRKPVVVLRETYKETTNNRMELMVVIRSVEFSRKLAKKERIGSITIWTDSRYVFDNQNMPPYWRSAGWKNKEGRIIENIDLWRKFLSLQSWGGRGFSIRWNKGKETSILKSVDQEAKKSAKGLIAQRDFGYRVARVAPSKSNTRGAPSIFPANGQSAIIRVYGRDLKKAGSVEEYKIKFDLFSKADGRYTGKYFAYLEKNGPRDFHLHHCYQATFNNSPGHPLILTMEEIEPPATTSNRL